MAQPFGGHRRRDRKPKPKSPKVEHRLASGKIRQLPPILRDGSCRGCGRKVDPMTGDCGCTA